MGRHRVYSARARGAFAPRAGQQRQQMRGGGGSPALKLKTTPQSCLRCQNSPTFRVQQQRNAESTTISLVQTLETRAY